MASPGVSRLEPGELLGFLCSNISFEARTNDAKKEEFWMRSRRRGRKEKIMEKTERKTKKDAHKEKREIMKLENARGNIDDCLT